MLSNHSEHSDIDDEKSEKLPNQICAHSFGEFCGYRRIIALFVRFS
jgi:hypothetical protein